MHSVLNAIFDCMTTTMRLTGLILLVLFVSSESYNPKAFDYILRSIEYEASIESGLFRCIFYDVSRHDPFRNILGDILKSPRLENTLKYVVTNGSFENKLDKLPWHPSMLLMYPGSDADHLQLDKTSRNLAFVMECFNPTTKVMIITNTTDYHLVRIIVQRVLGTGFNSLVIFDPFTMVTVLLNKVWQIYTLKPPAPQYLFTRLRRKLTGCNITYVSFAQIHKKDIVYFVTLRWIQETARYLDTEVSEYQHGCNDSSTRAAYYKCLERKADEIDRVDIKVKYVVFNDVILRGFEVLFTTLVMSTRVAVPRDRPLNAFELMLMPFSWQVWILMLVIFFASEVAAQLFPSAFLTDPVLLAVCGFDRHNLHQVRQLEKILLHSLIVLMFFMSNAFETKIVSLMIGKPSIQRIKTLEDLAKSNVKFSGHLDTNPYYVNEPIIGPMIVNGTHYSIYDQVPGFGLYLLREQAEVLKFTAFDFERMQPWYILLDYEFYIGPATYHLSWRNNKLETFRYIQTILTEAGLTDLWTRQWQYEVRPLHQGRKLFIEAKVVLNFEDMKLAWSILAIGLSIGTAALLGEFVRKRLGTIWMNYKKSVMT